MGQHKLTGPKTAALALTMVLSTSCTTLAEHADDRQQPTETTNPYLESLRRSADDANHAPETDNSNITPPFAPQYIPNEGTEGIDPAFIEALKRALEEAKKAPGKTNETIPFSPPLDDNEGPG